MNHKKWGVDNLERLDGLIAKGRGVRDMPGDARALYEDAFEEWRTGSLDFILEEFGADSKYYRDFVSNVKEASAASCDVGIGILTALKHSLEELHPAGAEKPQAQPSVEEARTTSGEVESGQGPQPVAEAMPKKGRKTAPLSGMVVLEGILWQAEVQLSQGHKDAAAVLCGAVLEEALRWLCARHNIPTREWDTIGNLADRLLDRGIYDESMHDRVISWWYLREDAHSVNFDAYDKEDVTAMIKGVQDFLKDCSPPVGDPRARRPGLRGSKHTVGNGLYPLKFRSIFKKTPWGGDRLGALFGKDVPPGGGIGESWEVADREGDNSIIANGIYKDMRLHQLLEGARAGSVLGAVYGRERGERFPLLVKFIDTVDRLSLQVHPDDAYVRAHEPPGESGKMEAWYVIYAEPGAWVIRGTRPGTTREILENLLERGRVEECLNFLSVHVGDVIFIPPGTLHAIGPGIVILEVQQNSDITYRLYDWGRSRELHVQKALDVIDFAPAEKHGQDKIRPTLLSPAPKKRELLLECEKFVLELFELSVSYDVEDMCTFDILTIIDGVSRVIYGRSEEIEVLAGESVLIPAILGGYELRPEGRCKIIKASPPLAD